VEGYLRNYMEAYLRYASEKGDRVMAERRPATTPDRQNREPAPAVPGLILTRPRRADARRNFDALLAAAKDVFAEQGTEASLEEIARRADVGIGTLYRNFPTRQALLEAVYVNEVEALAATAAELTDLEPWPALLAYLDRFVAYAATKKALMEGLNRDNPVFGSCRHLMYEAGEPLLERAQKSGAVRSDTGIDDVMRLVTSVANAAYPEEGQRERVLALALDGLRVRG
jgi:AcrR family transcriptional regulator